MPVEIERPVIEAWPIKGGKRLRIDADSDHERGVGVPGRLAFGRRPVNRPARPLRVFAVMQLLPRMFGAAARFLDKSTAPHRRGKALTERTVALWQMEPSGTEAHRERGLAEQLLGQRSKGLQLPGSSRLHTSLRS